MNKYGGGGKGRRYGYGPDQCDMANRAVVSANA